MPKDNRIWAKFDVDMPDNAKILPLSDAAFRALVEMTLWSRKTLSDGFLASRYAVARWSLEVCQELCTNDPSKPSLVQVENGYEIRDFAEFQDTRVEVEARRERNKAAGQRGGVAKAKRSASKSLSESLPETETETETELPTDVGSKRATRLPKTWTPTPEHHERARRTGIDISREVEKFRLWCEDKGAISKSWNSRFTTWLTKAAEYAAKDAARGPRTSDRQGEILRREMEAAIVNDARNEQPRLEILR